MKKVIVIFQTPWKIANELVAMTATPITYILILVNRIRIGSGSKFYGVPVFLKGVNTTINIGEKFENRNFYWSNPLGITKPTIFCTWKSEAKLLIGDNVGISGGSIVASSAITIGDGTLIGANCTIVDTDFHPVYIRNRRYVKDGVSSSPVVIGKNVFIGMNSIILKGVRIGDNSVIGAGSVVTASVPRNVVAAGNPARVIRRFKPHGR